MAFKTVIPVVLGERRMIKNANKHIKSIHGNPSIFVMQNITYVEKLFQELTKKNFN